MSNAFSSRASRRCRSSKNGQPRKEASVAAPLVALEAGLLLRGEGLVGAREVLGLHADRLRLGLGLERLLDREVPLLMQAFLGLSLIHISEPTRLLSISYA